MKTMPSVGWVWMVGLVGWTLVSLGRPALGSPAAGTWSNFGSPLASVPKWYHCKMPTWDGSMFVPTNTTIYQTSFVSPAFAPLASGWSGQMPFRIGVNALGHPLANPQNSTVSYWDGSAWKPSTFDPPPSGQQWWLGSVANFVLIPETGDILTAGNFKIMRSSDDGATFHELFDLGTVCPSGGGYGYVYTLERMPWGELFAAGETDTFYHSLDDGLSWSALPPFNKGGNRHGSVATKDGEVLLSSSADSSGNIMFRYTREGAIVPAMGGLSPYMFNSQTTYVMNLAASSSGENFIVAWFQPYFDGLKHVLAWNGATWTKIEAEPNGPGTDVLADMIGSDGTSIYVQTPSRQLKKWTPASTLPFAVSAGVNMSVAESSVVTLQGSVAPSGSYDWSWAARGPGTVVFDAPTSLATTATFSAIGDYVVNLRGSDGAVTAGASIIVHYGTGVDGCPNIPELPSDGVDNDCDGAVDEGGDSLGCAVDGDLTGDGTSDIADVQCSVLTALWDLAGGLALPPSCLSGGDVEKADANCDAQLDVIDVLLAIAKALGAPPSTELDANGDGCVDACHILE